MMRPDLGAHQFGGVGIALLRHHRGAGGELIGKLDQADERRRPDHDLLGQPRQMYRGDGRGGQRLHDEIAVGDGVERIRHRPVEAERLGAHVAVERKRSAGQRAGAERRLVEPFARVGEPPAVARGHLDIGKQVMAEGHRLRGLQMRETRHHRAGVFERLLDQSLLQTGKRAIERVDGVAHPQPEIGRHLVVTRARGVQPPRRRPDQRGEPRLDVHVDVFQRPLEAEFSGLHL